MVPKFTPVTWTGVAGVVLPSAIKTLGGTVALVGSLLTSAMVTPPEPAGADSVTGRVTLWPGATVMFVPMDIVPPLVTNTVALPGEYPEELAVMVALPLATPVMLKVPVVLP